MVRQLISAGAILILAATATASDVVTVDVGGVAIRIPAPEGFYRIDGRNAEYDNVLQASLSRLDRRLAMFGSEVDLADLLSGRWPTREGGNLAFDAQVSRAMERIAISRHEFQGLKREQKEQLGAQLASPEMQRIIREIESGSTNALSDSLDSNMQIAIGDLIPLGVFDETPESLLFAVLMTASVGGTDIDYQFVGVTAGATVHIRDRVIYLYSSSKYQGADDLGSVRDSLRKWRDDVVRANQGPSDAFSGYIKPHGPAETYALDRSPAPVRDGIDWKKVMGKVVAAGIAIFLIGIVRAAWPGGHRHVEPHPSVAACGMYNVVAKRPDSPTDVLQIAAPSPSDAADEARRRGWEVKHVEPAE